MSETITPTYQSHENVASAEEQEKPDTTVRVVTWAIILLAVVLVIAATVFLVMGVVALIAVVSPILVAGMLAWLVFLSMRVIHLEKRLADHRLRE